MGKGRLVRAGWGGGDGAGVRVRVRGSRDVSWDPEAGELLSFSKNYCDFEASTLEMDGEVGLLGVQDRSHIYSLRLCLKNTKLRHTGKRQGVNSKQSKEMKLPVDKLTSRKNTEKSQQKVALKKKSTHFYQDQVRKQITKSYTDNSYKTPN